MAIQIYSAWLMMGTARKISLARGMVDQMINLLMESILGSRSLPGSVAVQSWLSRRLLVRGVANWCIHLVAIITSRCDPVLLGRHVSLAD